MIAMGGSQHLQAVCGAHWLVELDFSSGLIRATTAPVDVTAAGNTYTGLGAFLGVGAVRESEDSAAERITISLPVVNSAMLAATMGPAATYRGRAARLYLQLFDEQFQPVGPRVARWSGYMEPVRITRTPASVGNGAGSGTIELPCQRAGMARARNYQGLRITHSQQLARYPGDMGLQYLQTLIEQPALWLSKRFQEQT
jgi:hypothetical protein